MYFWKLQVPAVCFFLLVRRSSQADDERHGVSFELGNTDITRFTYKTLHQAGFRLHHVEHITIMNAPKLKYIAVEDFSKMPRLKSLYITQAPMLEKVDPLPTMLELRTVIITSSGLTEVPNLSRVHPVKNDSIPYLQAVDLDGNQIKRIPAHALRIRADQVSINYNMIEDIPAFAFKYAQISKLSLKGNVKLSHLDENAFAGNLLLRQLDLSFTAITSLPTAGLEKLQSLKIENTPSLKYIPSIYDLRHLETADLTHSFHCCAFAYPERHDPARHKLHEMQVELMTQACKTELTKSRKRRSLAPIRPISLESPSRKTIGPYDDSISSSVEDFGTTIQGDADMEFMYSDSNEELADDDSFHELVEADLSKGYVAMCGNFSVTRPDVICRPMPNALNPCEDVMGWSWLRASVWFVITAAVVGNVAVLMVLLANHAEITVPRFLMCHLAFSDLCTGIYLFMLAVVDLRSYGVFFNYAYNWQYGVGCKIAGFLSVFSGQLSVFTLTIVTLERWFAITYAIYLERRISLAAAAKIMVGGWLFSFLMAGLPLLGVSDYSSTSICLPVESKDIGDGIYQGSLFLTTMVAWVIIVVCYVQIYRSLGGGGEKYGGRGSAAAAERRIANKMALLIGTDLLCWAPVAFFGVTALVGWPLVDVSHGKVLLVFFYPLNACANPFLYAILTKQYRRDFMTLIARTGQCNWLVEKYKLATTPPPTAHTNPSAPAAMMPLVDYENQSRVSKVNGEAGF
ncbi:follicle-stimulating hormone receptor-like [Amyelois transitella]|uniref:follicle-stimulating hormone receptor-like n=1 Tax=Amyelois transitella TaxID=680683 RepID=UPI002990784A|nr:follicle-stimulating hormone receptor-like [Amyelois transitella]